MVSENSLGHQFNFTPAMSIYVQCSSKEEFGWLFTELSAGGQVMMPLADDGFSKRFGWISDKYGVSWQLNLNS